MRRLTLLFALAIPAAADGPERVSCVTHCHGEEKVAHAASVHATRLSCVDCHGGNAAAERDKDKSHDPAAGYVGVPARADIPEHCGGCHSDPLRMHAFALSTDQLAHYRASVHGKALFGRNDTKVAVCTDCHGTHGILPAHDPRASTARANQPATCGKCHADEARMKPYGLPADGVDRFLKSVHGRALREGQRGAPSCADCHGSHGATPPGVAEVVQVCGQCHARTAEEYGRSPHARSDEMRCNACHEEEAYRGSSCTACHATHEIEAPGMWMAEGTEVGHCGHCHREPDGSEAVVAAIREGRGRLRDAMQETSRELNAAKSQGLFLEHEEVYLRESARALVAVRPLTHSLDPAAIRKHLEDGLKRQDRTREMIAKKGKVLRDRRILVSGLALLLLVLAGLLAAKLRAVRRLS